MRDPGRGSGSILGRRAALALAGAALPLPGLRAQERAEGFPSRPVRLVLAFAAGGNSDTLARLIAPRMAAVLGQNVVIDNRAGAGGALAAGQVASAPADGHTLLFDAASFVVAQFINRSLPFSYERDFAPVGLVAEVPYILAVTERTGIRDLRGFLEAARTAPGGLSYGSPGVGNTGHLAGALLAQRTGVRLEHVPYRGGAEVARDLAAGTLESGFLSANSLNPVLDGGRARAIAVTSARPNAIPGVPGFAAGGGPEIDLTSWNALFCRSGTPDAVRARLTAAVDHATADPELRARFAEIGATATAAEPARLAERVENERRLVQELIREAGLSLG
ncbi:Bug family tripartite tricarboxylate transporter substrate binding protein [Roseomonas sp. BN140053]|uniref:Bug family tripartite tricarboxylate transporter substrate binding protein n=1 Tax=Roseomonas sp. BN140053 TaxID=3391898 RepID=UPI0039EA0CBC